MSDVTESAVRRRRARHPVLLAVGIGCYALGATVAFYALADDFGLVPLILLWGIHAVLLALLIAKLGAEGSSTYATLFIVGTSALSVHTAGLARDDLVLERRGMEVTATVVREWRESGGRTASYFYELERRGGTRVRGPAMRPPNDRYDVGQTLRVIEDPRGELRPQTPGQVDTTGEAVGAGAFSLAAVLAVVGVALRGSRLAGRETARAIAEERLAREEQESRLRAILRAYPAERRGYLEVSPEDFPLVPRARAARIAWETGLRAEAADGRGSWRFGETVNEEAPRD
ncbi:hypothetical protein OG233_01650 [Streptomyces sp. NBC_01218]|uniref:hypothetical protein n=1 Tax=Streptomyces sp. NBC_01218 TaxID=2903780 RepID=UPI002E12D068|nr:hypothetical protein OG233_01650 [Streptomyces sp. NBC_01218]